METFKKILVAKYSPKNACNVPDGEPLTVVPKKNRPLNKDTGHRFVGVIDKSKLSRYGWVAEAPPFTLEEFIEKYLGSKEVGKEGKDHIKIMLSSISQLPVDTAVAATYFVRGDLQKTSEFVVHKVIFYYPKD